MIKCWNVQLQYIEKESDKGKENIMSLDVKVQASQSLCPDILPDQKHSMSSWLMASRSKL